MTSRYEIRPIADENCASLADDVLFATDDAQTAIVMARTLSGRQWGTGLLDTQTGAIDVGFGFGVPCPELSE